MAKFVLQPCKIRGDRVAPQKGAGPVSLSWPELCDTLVPGRSEDPKRFKEQAAKLRLVQPQSYVGTMVGTRSGRLTTFFLLNSDRSNQLTSWLRKDPLLAERIKTIYRVDVVDWGKAIGVQEGR